MVLRDLGLERQSVTLPTKRPKSEALLFSSFTMRVNYLSLDRLDLSFAAGSLA